VEKKKKKMKLSMMALKQGWGYLKLANINVLPAAWMLCEYQY